MQHLLESRFGPSPPHRMPLAAAVAALQPGCLRAFVGTDQSSLRRAIGIASAQPRRILFLDLATVDRTQIAVERVLADLADLALALWSPRDPNEIARFCADDSAVQFGMHRPSRPWRRAAARLMAAGRPPRFRHTDPSTEIRQLLSAIDAAGLTLVATIDHEAATRAAPVITALEWCARNGAAVIALLTAQPASVPPWDRILFDALDAHEQFPPVEDRLISPPAKSVPGSIIERRLRTALLAEPELAHLFEYEVTIPTTELGRRPRVDLLWRAGRIVVEIDGDEHSRDPNYGADRHRDYELLVAGYLVLRLTNDQIATDLQRAIDKIRRVVQFRREGANRDV